jgi:redox-sensitive bicupin YhaK (pirin superfamily)
MAEDWMKAPTEGFPTHPHRGFETVTIVLEGICKHQDSRGNQGILEKGDIQWMTAGAGVQHSEMPHGDETCHCLQLWINLPGSKKYIPPSYYDIKEKNMPTRNEEGTTVFVYGGKSGNAEAANPTNIPIKALRIKMKPNSKLTEDIPAHWNGFAYILSGEATIGTLGKLEPPQWAIRISFLSQFGRFQKYD